MLKAPSFAELNSTSEAQTRAKRANRSRDTSAELKLRKALWSLGARYRVSPKNILGKPDIVFSKARVAVFCDGEFWHGRAWGSRQKRLARGANAEYWLTKIAYNIERDQSVTAQLTQLGWRVLRFWESDIKAEPNGVARHVIEIVAPSLVRS